MKIICLGNYPPRQCGIATFTENLVNAIIDAAEIRKTSLEIEVIAMDDIKESYPYPSIVSRTIEEQKMESYIQTSDYINNSGADILLVQHEYGIYGGASGVLLLSLLRRVKIPIVTTFHTILVKPDFHQKEVLKKIAAFSSKIIIMNRLAIGFLHEIYEVPEEKIIRIEHGVPDYEYYADRLLPKPKEWESRKVIMTFGLIGRSKGIETAIRAMPEIVAKHPEVLYVVLGKTHPNIIRYSGEEYRDYLKKLAEDLGVSDNVVFINKYTSELELMSLLKASDMYATPYLNKAQITSGTLSYAASGGCAVFSTPYWHAEELLSEGRGILFDFGNYNQLAALVNHSLDHPESLQNIQLKAYQYGLNITWPKVGQAYLEVFQHADQGSFSRDMKAEKMYPPVDLTHLVSMTKPSGLLQHAHGSIPSFQHGYSLDDNARAMLVVLRAWQIEQKQEYLKLIQTYFSYLLFMKQKDGSFKNFMSFAHSTFEDDFSDDTYGRTIWALGSMIRFLPHDSLFQTAHEIFHESLQHISKLKYARGYSNCIFGLFHYIKRYPDQERFLSLTTQLADTLCMRYEQHKRENWHWFEDAVTYDNGLIPAALYKAYELTGKSKYLEFADQSRIFLEGKCFRNSWLSLVGNHKWLRFDTEYELFAQQPVDAMAMVIMYESAWEATKNQEFIQKMLKSFDWFFGDNDMGIGLYDNETKGCNDGIEASNINLNQGAESTIAYLMSRLIVEPYLKNPVT
jgi:glycosyltransferase involved in cell wall biosynthesis